MNRTEYHRLYARRWRSKNRARYNENQRKWRASNPNQVKIYQLRYKEHVREYRKRNHDRGLIYQREYRKRHRERVLERNRRYDRARYEKRREKQVIYARLYRQRTRDNYRKWKLAWRKKPSSINYRLSQNLRRRLLLALRNNQKSAPTIKLLGCSIEDFKIYLESKFEVGMSWDNYGRNGWHIDHIMPCAIFDLSKPEHQKRCFHFSNLQPLWEADNIRKSNRITLATRSQRSRVLSN